MNNRIECLQNKHQSEVVNMKTNIKEEEIKEIILMAKSMDMTTLILWKAQGKTLVDYEQLQRKKQAEKVEMMV